MSQQPPRYRIQILGNLPPGIYGFDLPRGARVGAEIDCVVEISPMVEMAVAGAAKPVDDNGEQPTLQKTIETFAPVLANLAMRVLG